MKVLRLLLIVSALAVFGCKTQHLLPEPSTPEPLPQLKSTNKDNAPAIVMKEESVSVPAGEDQSLGNKRYYVILGSFSGYQNAQNFKKQLMNEGFYPGILVNQNGLYRVCVDSYDNEAAARKKVTDIRTQYKQYSDVWLLIKKDD